MLASLADLGFGGRSRDNRPQSPNPRSLVMAGYILRRTLLAIPTLFAISVLSFIIMHLPPGDF